MTVKKTNQIRIIKLLITNHHTTGEIAEELGYETDGHGSYSTITEDLKKLKGLELIYDKEIKRPGVRGPDPTAYFIKKDILVLSKITQNYYDNSSRWQLSSSNYCKELRPDIVEHFNKRLEDAKLDLLTTVEHTALDAFLNYPSVLFFILCNTTPLNRIAEVNDKPIKDLMQNVRSNLVKIYRRRGDRNQMNTALDVIKTILFKEQTFLVRTFISLSQTDRLMGYVPEDEDKEWQKIITSTVLAPSVERVGNESYEDES